MISCDIHPSLSIWNLQGNMWPIICPSSTYINHHRSSVPASDAMPWPFGWIWLTIAFAACFDHRWTMRQHAATTVLVHGKVVSTVGSYKDRCWISWRSQPLVSQMLSHFKSPWDYASFACAILSLPHMDLETAKGCLLRWRSQFAICKKIYQPGQNNIPNRSKQPHRNVARWSSNQSNVE